MDEAKIPVIVGVGQINDRPVDDREGLNSLALMAAALQAADADAGGGWLAQIQSLAVVAQLSFPELGDLSRPLAEAIGASPGHCVQTRYPSGESPVLLLNQAANRIAAGEAEICAVAGGEALRTAARRGAAGNPVREASERAAKPLRHRYGIVAPTDIYPLYENACRAAWGQSLAEAQAESAEIWSRLSEVAAANAHAWLRKPLTPADILAVTPDNRPIAFPYTKLMVANASVNQGAGFIVASLAKAKAMGVPETQLVYVGAGAGAREPGDIFARDNFHRSPSLETVLTQTLARNQVTASDLDAVELYSCFPCIPKLARRAIAWPLDKPVTVFGGLTFGGGPVGNYMSHAIAAMCERLRRDGRHGLVFGNGGFATTNHAILLSRDSVVAKAGPRDFNVQAEADADRPAAPAFLEDYEGPGRIETYTVFYERSGAPKQGVIVARTDEGARLLARVSPEDIETLALLGAKAGEPVGTRGLSSRGRDGLNHWSSSAS